MERNYCINENVRSNKAKRAKKRINIKFIIFILIIFILLLNKGVLTIGKRLIEDINIIDKKEENINPEDFAINDKYLGIGQKRVEGMDGYDTTFTSTGNKFYKEYKQVGNASWKDKSYWGGSFEENGCGLAAIATLLSGYNMNYTPEDLRKIYINFPGEHLEGDQMASELKERFEIDNTDFLYADIYFRKKYIFEHLNKDKPILICVWNKPDDKWTTASHYLLLLACDNDNKVYVSNPNGLYGKNKMSGWYNAEDILPYIAKAMFINE